MEVGPAVEEYMATVDPDGMVRAVLVHHGGDPVVERYTDSTADDYWDTRSVTKSVVSTLVGIAIAEEHLDGVQQSLGELLPSRQAEMSDATAAVTLHQVLTHTAGFAAESGAGKGYFFAEDWVGQILVDRDKSSPVDGSFTYSNAGAHLLSAILVEATGVPGSPVRPREAVRAAGDTHRAGVRASLRLRRRGRGHGALRGVLGRRLHLAGGPAGPA